MEADADADRGRSSPFGVGFQLRLGFPLPVRSSLEVSGMPDDIVSVKNDPNVDAFLSALDDDARAALEQQEVVPSAIEAAPYTAITTVGFDDLCLDMNPVEHNGFPIPHDGHTGAMMFLGISDVRESDRFEDYAGYVQIAALHPKMGRVLISHSVPKGRDGEPIENDLIAWFRHMKVGNLFTVAKFTTQNGYRVFRPVPLQAPYA